MWWALPVMGRYLCTNHFLTSIAAKTLPSAHKNQWSGREGAKRRLWWHHRGAQRLGWGLFSLCILRGSVGGLGWRACACAAGRQLRRPQLLKGYGTLSISNCSMKLNMKKPFATFSEVSLLRILNVLSFDRAFLWRNEMLPQHLWTDLPKSECEIPNRESKHRLEMRLDCFALSVLAQANWYGCPYRWQTIILDGI